MSLVALNLYSA